MADRRAIAEKLVDLHVKHAATFGLIDDLKEQLRKVAEGEHAGFTEEFAGKGLVKVSAGAEEKFRGIMPVLDEAAFLALAPGRQKSLIEAKVVSMVNQWTKPSRPSVTVKL